jgi:hypothetical protein
VPAVFTIVTVLIGIVPLLTLNDGAVVEAFILAITAVAITLIAVNIRAVDLVRLGGLLGLADRTVCGVSQDALNTRERRVVELQRIPVDVEVRDRVGAKVRAEEEGVPATSPGQRIAVFSNKHSVPVTRFQGVTRAVLLVNGA